MVQQVQEGKDIIYGVRKERKTDTFLSDSPPRLSIS